MVFSCLLSEVQAEQVTQIKKTQGQERGWQESSSGGNNRAVSGPTGRRYGKVRGGRLPDSSSLRDKYLVQERQGCKIKRQ